MTYLLSIETGLGAATVALLQDGALCAQSHASTAHANAAETLPLTEALLQDAGIGFAALEAIACGIGPGSFTGIRIGLALARGLALAANKPLIGVNTLEATAFATAHHGTVLVAIDAMRGQLYTQAFALENGLPTALEEAVLRGPDECAVWLAAYPTAALAGNAQTVLAAWLEQDFSARWLPGMADAATIGQLAWHYHQTGTPTPRAPLYVRSPDAKLPTKKPVMDI